jgi:hypothetical protein
MRRRDFITLLGGAAVGWPLAARAQQPEQMRRMRDITIGTEHPMTEASPLHLSRRTAFGAAAAGAALAAATFSGTSSMRAQTRSKGTFVLVHPAWFGGWCWKKVTPLLRAGGYDVYTPTLTGLGERTHLARGLGVRLVVLSANTEDDFRTAFASLAQHGAGALLVCATPFFNSRRPQLVLLATRHGVPAIYEWCEFAEAGGLMSYGTSLNDAYRQAAVYAGRILKGAKPVDLPVVQSTKFEFVINLNSAKALGFDVPPGLSARADEVIE